MRTYKVDAHRRIISRSLKLPYSRASLWLPGILLLRGLLCIRPEEQAVTIDNGPSFPDTRVTNVIGCWSAKGT